jgi:hypothetical protein
MKILAKSAPIKEQILDKIDKGCDGIEIQLLKDFFEEEYNANYFFEKIKNIENLDVKVVHLPFCESKEFNLEFFEMHNYKKTFLKAVKLSQLLADFYKHNIIIVIHNGFKLEQYLKIPSLLYYIEELFDECLLRYPNVEYAFENILPFVLNKDRDPSSRNGFLYDNVDLAIYFNRRFSTNVFGTVVDTCHFMITERIFKSVFSEKYSDVVENISLEKIFEKNKDIIKLFHLANAKNLGYDFKEHGCSFKENNEDNEFLNNFFKLYEKYVDDAYITLEIIEDNYLDSKGYLETKNCIQKFI